MQSISENDFECLARTGVNTPGTMFSNSRFCEGCISQKPTSRTRSPFLDNSGLPFAHNAVFGGIQSVEHAEHFLFVASSNEPELIAVDATIT
jgi:hypothetical protein